VRGLELSKADFGVTGGGAIDRVTVDGDTVTITVTFEAKVYGNPGSHPVLTAGVSTVTVAAGDTEKAAVFFTGAAGLELTTADFSVTGGGAIDRVTMDGDTVTVTITVTFEANMLPSAKVYNVVVASTSSIVRGSANVKIIHLGKDGEAPSLASEIFVSREGSDIQGIGSREYPFATLAYAYTVAADGQYSPIDDTVHAAEFPGLMNQLPFVLY
jgi:hypothetical protein